MPLNATLSFYGAAGQVTGSCYLLNWNQQKVLLDCGMVQGGDQVTDLSKFRFAFRPKDIDAVVLSHAHIDHSGLIPKLCKDGFSGKIFCTPATKQLGAILLEDSAEIQEDDVKYENKRRAAQGLPYLKPLYTREDAENAIIKLHDKDKRYRLNYRRLVIYKI